GSRTGRNADGRRGARKRRSARRSADRRGGMTMDALREKATRFRRLHDEGRLLLPNAWDAASARVLEMAGFPAVATTSAGIAWARGLRDGERIDRETMKGEIASIARVLACPVTADVEAGYGAAPEDVAATIDAVVDAGAVGVNLEDSRPGPGAA